MSPDLDQLAARLDGCLLSDRPRLEAGLERLRRRVQRGLPYDRGYTRLARDLAASTHRVEARRASIPAITLPPELPITARREAIAEAIVQHPVTVVCGETGSGKSTQLPKLCLDLGRGTAGKIGHTQPRRVAARALARRIAAELGSRGRATVGYKVRFADRTSPHSLIKLLTDGMLLSELRSDPRLLQYDTLIVDEAHERSLNIDLILGVLSRLLPLRPELRVVITSATIDPEKFSRFFDGAPVVEVSGRGFPVELRYRPPDEAGDAPPARAMLAAIDEIDASPQGRAGDTLVFLAGERDIREAANAVRKHHREGIEVLPLYARLSAAQQDRVFRRGQQRRIVLATNVAETSLTVPGITAVIDPGLARLSRYSRRSKIQRLPVEPVSQASADQRKGRCGRVAPGLCIRLYSEEDFAQRPAFTEPEILRTNLAQVILQMALLGLGDIERFPFPDPPDRRLVADGWRLLEELQAVDPHRELTPLGRRMAELPLDPRLARVLLAAAAGKCLAEGLVLVSVLSIPDPRERPAEQAADADRRHLELADPSSDFLALLALWDAFQAARRHRSTSAQRRWCRERFVAFTRMREWEDLHRQLRKQLAAMGLEPGRERAPPERIHRALLTGFIDHVGVREDAQRYRGARNLRFRIFPGSGLQARRPRWIVAASLIETSRPYAITIARVRRQWVEEAGAHLLKRSYFQPHWNPTRGRVEAFERATLYGLLLHAKRRRDYGTVDPAAARQIFLREALVEGRLATKASFAAHNRELRRALRASEAKLRRDVLTTAEQQLAFFDQRIPPGVHSARGFERWRRGVEREHPRLLYMESADLRRADVPEPDAGCYPDVLALGSNRLVLSYRFEPGHPRDGVTVTVPLALVGELRQAQLDWLVPGHLEETLEGLLRGLPKSLRRVLPAVQDCIAAARTALRAGATPLPRALSDVLAKTVGIEVPVEAWNPQALASHLRVNVRVVDQRGETLAEGRNLAELQARLAPQGERSLRGHPRERVGIRRWDVGELPVEVKVREDTLELRAYPALEDRGDSVALRLLRSPEAAARTHRDGVTRLFVLALPQQAKWIRDQVCSLPELALLARGLGGPAALAGDLQAAVFSEVFLPPGASAPRSADTFEHRLGQGRASIVPLAEARVEALHTVLREHQRLQGELGSAPAAWAEAISDMREQLQGLVYPGFVRCTPPEWFAELPRYLRAMSVRLDKLRGAHGKDASLRAQIRPHWERYCALPAELREGARPDGPLARYRWMIEEFRVSLYAQPLGTRGPVSAKRLERLWDEVEQARRPN